MKIICELAHDCDHATLTGSCGHKKPHTSMTGCKPPVRCAYKEKKVGCFPVKSSQPQNIKEAVKQAVTMIRDGDE